MERSRRDCAGGDVLVLGADGFSGGKRGYIRRIPSHCKWTDLIHEGGGARTMATFEDREDHPRDGTGHLP